MAGQTTSLATIVRAELAIEIMNNARGLVSERVAAIEAEDPIGAEALRARRRALIAVQNSIGVDDADRVEDIISEWGPRVKDPAQFWREL